MKTILKDIYGHIRRKIRVIIWKQWKKICKRYTMLRKLGISQEEAYMTVNTRKGYYYVAGTRILHTAISNKRLTKRGLVSPLDYYGGVKEYHINKYKIY